MAAVHQVARAGVERQDFHHGPGRAVEPVEQQQRHATMLGQRLRVHGGFGNQRQGPFRTDEHPSQIEMRGREHVGEVIARAIDQALRLVLGDQLGIAADRVGQGADELSAARSRVRCASFERFAADFQHLAVGQHDLQAANVPPGRAIAEPVAAAGIDRDHAAHRGDAGHGRVGPEVPAAGAEQIVEMRVHDSRLDADRVAVVVDQPPHVAREVEDQAGAQRFAGQARARAARKDR